MPLFAGILFACAFPVVGRDAGRAAVGGIDGPPAAVTPGRPCPDTATRAGKSGSRKRWLVTRYGIPPPPVPESSATWRRTVLRWTVRNESVRGLWRASSSETRRSRTWTRAAPGARAWSATAPRRASPSAVAPRVLGRRRAAEVGPEVVGGSRGASGPSVAENRATARSTSSGVEARDGRRLGAPRSGRDPRQHGVDERVQLAGHPRRACRRRRGRLGRSAQDHRSASVTCRTRARVVAAVGVAREDPQVEQRPLAERALDEPQLRRLEARRRLEVVAEEAELDAGEQDVVVGSAPMSCITGGRMRACGVPDPVRCRYCRSPER